MRQVPRWNLLSTRCSRVHAMPCRHLISTQRLSMLDVRGREICSDEGVIRMHEMHCRYNQRSGCWHLFKLPRWALFKRGRIGVHSMSCWSILWSCPERRVHVLSRSHVQCCGFKRLFHLSRRSVISCWINCMPGSAVIKGQREQEELRYRGVCHSRSISID